MLNPEELRTAYLRSKDFKYALMCWENNSDDQNVESPFNPKNQFELEGMAKHIILRSWNFKVVFFQLTIDVNDAAITTMNENLTALLHSSNLHINLVIQFQT